ncbi:MAG: hypothetical protein ACI9CF_001111 [Candidatus Omnitrophota bacterium]|jgi:hypothetical protein
MNYKESTPRFELYCSDEEEKMRNDFEDHFRKCPIPEGELLSNLGMFLSSKNLARILFMQHLYEKIVETQGVVMEFGTRWGQNLSLFAALRGIYEPFNRHRKIIGFDTFKGFPSISKKDLPDHDVIKPGGLAVTPDYKDYLNQTMEFQEKDNPMAHIKKFELREGDATLELPKYLKDNPQTIVSLAFFDLDIYEPTKKCLEAIKPHLVKGSILGFDELNDPDSPGETVALREVFDMNQIRLKRYKFASRTSYFVVE